MKVRALKRGFSDGQYRRRGDIFDCPKDKFCPWMEKITKGKMKPLEEPEGGYVALEIPSLMNKSEKE